MAASSLLLIVAAALTSLAWLLPNHYAPWSSFHSEITAAIGFSAAAVAVALKQRQPVEWPRLAMLCLAVAMIPPLQALCGLILFWGDAWIASLYLLGLALALVLGRGLAQQHEPAAVLRIVWLIFLGAAIGSVGIALYQWLSLSGLGAMAVDLPPNARPFSNLAQPNHLATLLVLGMVAALALRQRGDLGSAAFGLVLGYLCFGVVMTQSRTAWVAVAALLVGLWAARERTGLRVSRPALVALGVCFVLLTFAWPSLCEALYLPAGRSLDKLAGDQARLGLWQAIGRAILHAPWFGYGWNQVSVAQSTLALDNPPIAFMFEHSHNLLLDLMAWNGVPLGLLLSAALAWWFWKHVRACRDAATACLLAGIGVVGAHALLEFPIEYAYFLLPIGLMMGLVEGLSPAGRGVAVPRSFTLGLTVLGVAACVWVATEYFQAEDNYRQLRFESARIGTDTVSSNVPNLIVLTQLREFLRFTRTEARRGMSQEQLEAMRKVADRYGYPSVRFRYALALGLNGSPERAQDALARLCRMYVAARCEESRVAWQQMALSTHPELQAIPFPVAPKP